MITGFNTDIEHDGVVYHVQTEDKGLDSPIILSLVYAGGTILASKRSPYEDLIAEGFSDEVLAERLKRQHRLICAAIHSGRIDDLKKMSGRGKATRSRRSSNRQRLKNRQKSRPRRRLSKSLLRSNTGRCRRSGRLRLRLPTKNWRQ